MPFPLLALGIAAAVGGSGLLLGGGAYMVKRAADDVDDTRSRVSKDSNRIIEDLHKLLDRTKELVNPLIQVLNRFLAAVDMWRPAAADCAKSFDKCADILKDITAGFQLKRFTPVYMVLWSFQLAQNVLFDIDILNDILDNRVMLTLAVLHVEHTKCYKQAAGFVAIPPTIILLTYIKRGLWMLQSSLQTFFLKFFTVMAVLVSFYLTLTVVVLPYLERRNNDNARRNIDAMNDEAEQTEEKGCETTKKKRSRISDKSFSKKFVFGKDFLSKKKRGFPVND